MPAAFFLALAKIMLEHLRTNPMPAAFLLALAKIMLEHLRTNPMRTSSYFL